MADEDSHLMKSHIISVTTRVVPKRLFTFPCVLRRVEPVVGREELILCASERIGITLFTGEKSIQKVGNLYEFSLHQTPGGWNSLTVQSLFEQVSDEDIDLVLKV